MAAPLHRVNQESGRAYHRAGSGAHGHRKQLNDTGEVIDARNRQKKPCRPYSERQGLSYEGQKVPEALLAHQALGVVAGRST